MDKKLKQFAEENGLKSVSVHYHSGLIFGVYIHWGEAECRYGSGKTIMKALADALDQKNRVGEDI